MSALIKTVTIAFQVVLMLPATAQKSVDLWTTAADNARLDARQHRQPKSSNQQ